MGKYSIKELEQLSGIKAHTIRIWEKRHKIITPSRSSTNIRYYSDDDLKKIINVSLLNNSGIKISKIAVMSPADLNNKVMQISEVRSDVTIPIDHWVIAMIDMEEESFEKTLSSLILRHGFEKRSRKSCILSWKNWYPVADTEYYPGARALYFESHPSKNDRGD
jgi:DNA-binding transcriptional MerR regulator